MRRRRVFIPQRVDPFHRHRCIATRGDGNENMAYKSKQTGLGATDFTHNDFARRDLPDLRYLRYHPRRAE